MTSEQIRDLELPTQSTHTEVAVCILLREIAAQQAEQTDILWRLMMALQDRG